jgi:hypothetical protein
MRLAVVAAVVIAVGCQSGRSAPGAGSAAAGSSAASVVASPGSAAAAPSVDACAIGARALEQATPCASKADAKSWNVTRQGFTTVAGAAGNAGGQTAQVLCAQMLQAVDGDLQKIGCALDLSTAERTQLDALMTRWYAMRTPVVPTGNADADAVITRVAHARDKLCACADMACLKEVDATLDLLGALPDGAPQAAKDLGGALIDDMGRCEARLRNLGH